jgi:uncharacterized protein DUF3261
MLSGDCAVHVRFFVAFLAATASTLQGCASSTQADDSRAFLAPGLQFATPGPQELGAVVDVAQLITARYRGEIFVFETQLSISRDHLMMVGLDPLGRRAITITSTATGITAQTAPWLPAFIKPTNILADMAVVYWPTESVRRGLVGSGAELHSDALQRTITLKGREIIRVDYEEPQGPSWVGTVRYHNSAFGYELTLHSMKAAK